jgi:hypothetical protein
MPLLNKYKLPSIHKRLSLLTVAALWVLPLLRAQERHTQLANATVVIIRHAETPASGSSLTAEGFARANKYAQYFLPFHFYGTAVTLNALYAGADSADSVRPRLTLEPLSHASGLTLNTQFSTNDPEDLAHTLTTSPHGGHILIAWRHRKIPALLKALSAAPPLLLPDGQWPDSVYGWVIFLHYDAQGPGNAEADSRAKSAPIGRLRQPPVCIAHRVCSSARVGCSVAVKLKQILNIEPSSGALVTVISARWASAIHRAIESPNPQPAFVFLSRRSA